MKNDMLREAAGVSARNRRRRTWERVISVLTCAAVICTTCVQTLPVFAVEEAAPGCGKVEHTHSETCYPQAESGSGKKLNCTAELHHHTEGCYNGAGELVCGYADFVIHWHDSACYDENGNLWCTLPEAGPHTHSESCYIVPETEPAHIHTEECYVWERGELICTESTEEQHIHTEACYSTAEILSCTVPESDGHLHGEGCFDENGELICGLEESEGHHHDPECYEVVSELICPLSETAETHQHTDECYAQNQVLVCEKSTEPAEPAAPELVCGKKEIIPHEHGPGCFDGNGSVICGKIQILEHQHTDSCFETTETPDITAEPVCGLEEHTHDLGCYSDKTADVETPEDWERTMAHVELTGDWRRDVILIAESQLGYQESGRNYIVDKDGEKQGYTRYGDWYGDAYGDWCAMFVSFCLYYANIPAQEIPLEASCPQWIEKLQNREHTLYAPADGGYRPLPGDLVFFDWDGDHISDHVGLVAELTEDDQGTLTAIKTIEGNSGHQVQSVMYFIGDANILGYGILPAPESEDVQKTLTCTGEDYTVSVTYGADAALPDGVELRAEEYAHDSETYCSRLKEAVALYGWTEKEISTFRLFNIGLYLNGEEVEPAAAVKVTVTCKEMEEKERFRVTHFAEEKTEDIDAEVSSADGIQTVDFSTGGFSDYGIMLADARAAGNHPAGVKTENWQVSGVNLFNVNAANGNPGPMGGVTYTVYQNGKEIKSYTTGSEYATTLDGLVPGTYTIKQTGVPEGYTVVPQEKTFTVKSESGWTTAGVFYVYTENSFFTDKKAQVHNYENRVYEETLEALSNSYEGQINPGHFDFVIDRSNSMLFPAKLDPTGATVTLALDNDASWWTSNDASGNSNRMTNAITNAGLSTNDLYYVIARESETATVYALWRGANGNWYYQDASSYVLAEAGQGKFADDIASDTVLGNAGGCLNGADRRGENKRYGLYYDLGTDIENNGGQKTFTIYRVNSGYEYNRLTYLKYNMSQMIYELAALNPNNKITITTFDGEVQRCMTKQLDDAGVAALIGMVGTIETAGGTAQDHAMQHVIGEYTSASGCNLYHLLGNDYVFLITDGALNTKNQSYDVSAANLRAAADKIRNSGATLMTIGLSLDNVTKAKILLNDVNHGGIASNGWAALDIEADQLADTMQNALWGELIQWVPKTIRATVTDYISDSFYLVTPGGDVLAENDWLTLSGEKTYQGAENAAGKVCHDANGWFIQWEKQELPVKPMDGQAVDPWTGKFYIKAKEDFVGGNVIDTNKSASVTILDSTDNTAMTLPLETPTVNVRLLPIGEFTSEETVFLSDSVDPKERIQELLSQIRFTKIRENTGDAVYNFAAAADTEGLEDNSFTLAYAMKQALTDQQWADLIAGKEVRVEYAYDNAGSHGAVGYFTLTLTKAGTGSNYENHNTQITGKEAETYTLAVDYTAYGFGDADTSGNKRPDANVHNGDAGPGTEVGAGTALENGKGTLESTNIHKIHVVDGKITVTKEIDEVLKKTEDQTFTFTLKRLDSDDIYKEVIGTDGKAVTLDVTVSAGQTTGSATLDTLSRGTYMLAEKESDAYKVKEMTVAAAETNCQSAGNGTPVVTFTIGTDADGTDVIRMNTESPYHTLRGETPATDEACRGVSYGTVKVKNTGAYQLPTTGGMGTFLYTIGGLLLMAAAGSLLLYKNKQRGKEDLASF